MDGNNRDVRRAEIKRTKRGVLSVLVSSHDFHTIERTRAGTLPFLSPSRYGYVPEAESLRRESRDERRFKFGFHSRTRIAPRFF